MIASRGIIDATKNIYRCTKKQSGRRNQPAVRLSREEIYML